MAPITRSVYRVASVSTALKHYNLKIELDECQKKSCMVCGHKEVSEKLYGPMYMLNDVTVHFFCIMLSLRAAKNGGEKEGIWGYLLNDIKAEIKRGSKVICVYCNKKGATLSCRELYCQKQFHLPCGLKNGSMHHYFWPFNSFCQQHRILPVINVTELHPFSLSTVECGICDKYLIKSDSLNSIWVPCCRLDSWFHRDCVQDLALRKGYYIKCPKCEDVDTFKSRILTLGIYIPSRYITWQKRRRFSNSFPERVIKCDSKQCLCPHPEKLNYQNEFRWKLVLCRTCGFRASHKCCGSFVNDTEWDCAECLKMIASKTVRRRLEFPINGNSVGISAILGDVDFLIFPNRANHFTQQYILGYVIKREDYQTM